MKATISEHSSGLSITLNPESVKEYSQLLRYAKNAKKEKPSIYLSFRNEAYLSIWLRKIKASVQKNSI
jgi:hypothetical protein